MPFQSEKQRRYMHANLPELAQRWERDYADGGIARLPQRLTTDDTVGKQMIQMGTASGNALDNQTAFITGSPKDRRIQSLDAQRKQALDMGLTFPNETEYQNLLQEDKEGVKEGEWEYSLPKNRYAELPIGATGSMNDATWSGIGKNFSDLNFMNQAEATTNEGINTEGLSTDVFESPTAVSGTDFGNTNFFGEPVVDDVVSKSFKDYDNLKDWLDANPQMGENITRKAKEYYEKAKSGINWAAKAAMTGLGKAVNLPLGLMSGIASFKNPLNPNSANYNPRLQGQIDYLSKVGMLGGSSGPYKIRGGVLAGQNLVSMFGTNDYGQMLDKKQAWYEKRKEDKKSFSQKNWDKLKAEKKIEDARRMKEQLAAYSGPTTYDYDPKQGGGGGYTGHSDAYGPAAGPMSGSYGPWS